MGPSGDDVLERRTPGSCSASRMFNRASGKPGWSSACRRVNQNFSAGLEVGGRTYLRSISAWRRASALDSRVAAMRLRRPATSIVGSGEGLPDSRRAVVSAQGRLCLCEGRRAGTWAHADGWCTVEVDVVEAPQSTSPAWRVNREKGRGNLVLTWTVEAEGHAQNCSGCQQHWAGSTAKPRTAPLPLAHLLPSPPIVAYRDRRVSLGPGAAHSPHDHRLSPSTVRRAAPSPCLLQQAPLQQRAQPHEECA